MKTKEHEKFPKIDEQEKLIDWLQKFINTEQDFKNQLKSIKKVTENKENYGYLINYNTYKNWENNLKLNSLRSIIEQYKTEEKKLLTKDEKQQIINILINYNISKKNHIESLKFETIENLKAFNKENNLILLNKELFQLINDEDDKESKENKIKYEIKEKSIDIFINNEKSTFMKIDNVIYSYLYNNLFLLTKINIFQKNFFLEKKSSMVYMLSKELLKQYKECFLYKNLLPFLEYNNFNKRTSDIEIFDFVETIPTDLIKSIEENLKSFKLELKLISPKIIKRNIDINFSYVEELDSFFLNGNLFINFCSIHSLSSEENKMIRNIIKIIFFKEKLLILFQHDKNIFGQIGNINNSNEENIFDIDYLISIKKNNSKNYLSTFLNDILKDEKDYINFYRNIYNNLNQDDLFEYKISDELILNILNFKRYKENNYFFTNNNNKQIESRKIKNNNSNNLSIQKIQINKNNDNIKMFP